MPDLICFMLPLAHRQKQHAEGQLNIAPSEPMRFMSAPPAQHRSTSQVGPRIFILACHCQQGSRACRRRLPVTAQYHQHGFQPQTPPAAITLVHLRYALLADAKSARLLARPYAIDATLTALIVASLSRLLEMHGITSKVGVRALATSSEAVTHVMPTRKRSFLSSREQLPILLYRCQPHFKRILYGKQNANICSIKNKTHDDAAKLFSFISAILQTLIS